MTADQLTEKFLELRRKYRGRIEEAKAKEARAGALLEELRAIGGMTHGMATEIARGNLPPDLQGPIRREFWEEAHALLGPFMGLR